jgi:membrane associated rhomboid family serine protease
MGIHDRDYYREDSRRGVIHSIIPEGSVCKVLILAQIVFFIAQMLDRADPPLGQGLGLQLSGLLHGEIWRVITFGFVHPAHQGIVSFAFSLLFIWYFGSDLEQLYGSVEFLCFYVATTWLGGAAYLVAAFVSGAPDNVLMGAFGAVTAMTVLFAWHFPHHKIGLFFVLAIPMWLLAVAEIVVAVAIASDQVAYIMVGAAFGSLYYKKQWRLSGLFQGWSARRSRERSRAKLRVFKPENDEDDAEPVAVAAPKVAAPLLDEHLEAKVDAVLEKMARSGKESLSENERQILMQASEIYRRKRT